MRDSPVGERDAPQRVRDLEGVPKRNGGGGHSGAGGRLHASRLRGGVHERSRRGGSAVVLFRVIRAATLRAVHHFQGVEHVPLQGARRRSVQAVAKGPATRLRGPLPRAPPVQLEVRGPAHHRRQLGGTRRKRRHRVGQGREPGGDVARDGGGQAARARQGHRGEQLLRARADGRAELREHTARREPVRGARVQHARRAARRVREVRRAFHDVLRARVRQGRPAGGRDGGRDRQDARRDGCAGADCVGPREEVLRAREERGREESQGELWRRRGGAEQRGGGDARCARSEDDGV